MKAILKTNIIITQKGLSEQSFSVSRYCNHSRYSIGLRAHSLHGAELNQSLEQSRFTCCRYIITQKIKKALRQSVSVHSGCRGIVISCILYQIKSPSTMLRLRPLLPWYPYCSVRGGDILLFFF